jgi:plastocyanin
VPLQPRIAGTQVGQTVRFVNGDPLLHNVHGTPKSSPPWNVSLARKGATREIRVERPEVPVSVRCDLHPWMQGGSESSTTRTSP